LLADVFEASCWVSLANNKESSATSVSYSRWELLALAIIYGSRKNDDMGINNGLR
jgi:hypothetical protein